MELIINNQNELQQAVAKALDFAQNKKLFLLYGEIGAGKTTFIQAFCKHFGVKEAVVSPTFAIVNEYKSPDQSSIFHLDLYRLKSLEEAIDIGIEEYLYNDTYCFIEWPEIIEPLLPDKIVKISIEIVADSTRKMVFL